MALYFYQAYSRDGKKVSGYLDSSSTQAVKELLSERKLFPIQITLSTQQAKTSFFSNLFTGSVKLKDKIFFTKQLSVLLKSGVPLDQALELMVEQTQGQLQKIVISLKDGIKEGQSLAQGLEQYPKVFENIYVQLVKAGEATGKLDQILTRLVDFLEQREAIQKKVQGALRYPLIQLAVISLITIALLTFVVPSIADVFSQQNIQLPLPTRILMGISNFLTGHYILLISLLVLAALGYTAWSNTNSGAYTIDKIKLKLPIFKSFTREQAIVQFSRTLGMLMESGVNLSEALGIVVKIVDNKVLTKSLEEASDKIIKQGKIAQYLKDTGIFPPLAIYLINTGEQSGQLGPMLITVAKTYEDELKERADSLTALLNPLMLAVMGGVVGFIILSIMSPILSLMNSAQLQ